MKDMFICLDCEKEFHQVEAIPVTESDFYEGFGGFTDTQEGYRCPNTKCESLNINPIRDEDDE